MLLWDSKGTPEPESTSLSARKLLFFPAQLRWISGTNRSQDFTAVGTPKIHTVNIWLKETQSLIPQESQGNVLSALGLAMHSPQPQPTHAHTHIHNAPVLKAQVLPDKGNCASTVGCPRTKVTKRKQIIQVSFQNSLLAHLPLSLHFGQRDGKENGSPLDRI